MINEPPNSVNKSGAVDIPLEDLPTARPLVPDARNEFYSALTTLVKSVQPKVPDMLKRIEQFLDTKSRDMYEKLKKEMQQQVSYLIAKHLYDAEVLSREQFEAVVRSPQGRQVNAPVNLPNASSEALAIFDQPPPM